MLTDSVRRVYHLFHNKPIEQVGNSKKAKKQKSKKAKKQKSKRAKEQKSKRAKEQKKQKNNVPLRKNHKRKSDKCAVKNVR